MFTDDRFDSHNDALVCRPIRGRVGNDLVLLRAGNSLNDAGGKLPRSGSRVVRAMEVNVPPAARLLLPDARFFGPARAGVAVAPELTPDCPSTAATVTNELQERWLLCRSAGWRLKDQQIFLARLEKARGRLAKLQAQVGAGTFKKKAVILTKAKKAVGRTHDLQGIFSFALLRSAGTSIRKSAENSTLPAAFRGASFRSTICSFAAAAGSTGRGPWVPSKSAPVLGSMGQSPKGSSVLLTFGHKSLKSPERSAL